MTYPRCSPREARGFTLSEAIVAMSIFALLTGLGIPAYGQFLSYYRLHSEAQMLAWALQFARSEAIKRNTRVNVCKSFVHALWPSAALEWRPADGNVHAVPSGLRRRAGSAGQHGPHSHREYARHMRMMA